MRRNGIKTFDGLLHSHMVKLMNDALPSSELTFHELHFDSADAIRDAVIGRDDHDLVYLSFTNAVLVAPVAVINEWLESGALHD